VKGDSCPLHTGQNLISITVTEISINYIILTEISRITLHIYRYNDGF